MSGRLAGMSRRSADENIKSHNKFSEKDKTMKKHEIEEEITVLQRRIDQIKRNAASDGRALNAKEKELVAEIRDLCDEKETQIMSMPAHGPLTVQGFGGSSRTAGAGPFSVLGSQLQAIRDAGVPGGKVDQRLYNVASGLNETTPSDGGFLLQPDFSTDLLKSRNGTGKLLPYCKRLFINSSSIDLPVIDETSRATGSRWGGIRGFWIDEAGEKQASAPKFGKLHLEPKKQVVLVYATDELLQDVAVLSQVIGDGAAEEIGFMTDLGIVAGTGAGQPLGLLNSPCTISIDKEAGQANNTIVYENLTRMWSRLWPIGHNTAIWLVHPSALHQLYTMSLAVGTGGSPVFLPGGAASDKPFASLFGRPLIPCEQCSALGTAGDIILADLTNGYVVAERGNGIQADMSIHVRFVYDESVFRFVRRIDGQPIISAAITPYSGSDSFSPFIVLADRTA